MTADSAGAGTGDEERPPTITEVARHAGVSIATVSRVVSGRVRVREATRLRVEQAIAATGWAVDRRHASWLGAEAMRSFWPSP
jgi:DNA-binding LacI/PurR family transcriptional regulator